MADTKKPKIDLKARLGKKTVSSPGGPALPPPVGIPKPAVPGMAAPKRSAPQVDTSNPYSAISAGEIPAAKVEPQAIKVEMSAEVVAAQKKGRVRVMALMVFVALIGGLLGFAFGDRTQANKGAQAAIEGAGELIKEVDSANAVVRELDKVLKDALAKLGENKFPEEEVSKLGSINIPFAGSNLIGKGIGRFRGDTVVMLIQYASGAQEANDAKESLQLVMGALRKPIQSVLAQQDEKTRKVRWGLFVVNGPQGPWAQMQSFDEKQQFLVSKNPWPEAFKIKDGNREVELKRYTSGACTGSDPVMIPVDPTSQNFVCQADELRTLSVEINRLSRILAGDKSDPQNEKAGLIEQGDLLIDELKKIGQP